MGKQSHLPGIHVLKSQPIPPLSGCYELRVCVCVCVCVQVREFERCVSLSLLQC